MTYQEYKKFKDFDDKKSLPVSNKFEILSEEIDDSPKSSPNPKKRGVNNNVESPIFVNGFNPTVGASFLMEEPSFLVDDWKSCCSIDDDTSTSGDVSIDEDSKLEEMGPMTEWKGVKSVKKIQKS